jgi:hypothetical protein
MSEEPTRGYTLDELARDLANGSISRGRALKLLGAMAVAAVVPARLAAAAPKNKKVTICHKCKTISVSENAVPAHLAHGDTKGKCVKTTTTKKPKTTTSTTTPTSTTTSTTTSRTTSTTTTRRPY